MTVIPPDGTIYKALIWAIVSLLAWNLWQTNENTKEMIELKTGQQIVRDVIFDLRKEDIAIHEDLMRVGKEKRP